ncbi:MAG: TolB family protein, partial [Gammaproteobacteria bacterium]
MNSQDRFRSISLVLLALALGLSATRIVAQTSDEDRNALQEQERLRNIARTTAMNQRQLTAFDSQGRELKEIGEPGLYNFPQFSPDLSMISAVGINLLEEKQDIVIIDAETGEVMQITHSAPRESVGTPVWSPDSRELAYVALRGSYFDIYRQRADGQGDPALVYRHEGGPIVLADWSLDGRYLSFSASDLSGGRLFTL